MEEFSDSPEVIVADVDCTADGKDLCETHGVRGYPTIKHGTPSSNDGGLRWSNPNMEDYDGARDYVGFKKFLSSFLKPLSFDPAENLGPSCGPETLVLCDAEQKAALDKFMKMTTERLKGRIRAREAKLKKLEDDHAAFGNGLQEKQEAEEKKKDAAVAEVKASGVGLMKAVLATKDSEGKSEL